MSITCDVDALCQQAHCCNHLSCVHRRNLASSPALTLEHVAGHKHDDGRHHVLQRGVGKYGAEAQRRCDAPPDDDLGPHDHQPAGRRAQSHSIRVGEWAPAADGSMESAPRYKHAFGTSNCSAQGMSVRKAQVSTGAHHPLSGAHSAAAMAAQCWALCSTLYLLGTTEKKKSISTTIL